MKLHSGKSDPIRIFKKSIQGLRQNHHLRHRPTGFGFAFADRVAFLDRSHWQAVTGGCGLFLRPEILGVIENHGPENIVPRYAVVFRGEQPVAVVAAQLVIVRGRQLKPQRRDPAPRLPSALLRRVLSPAARVASVTLRERLLVAGNLLSWGFHGIAFAPGEEPAAIWPGVAEALYRLRRAERLTGQTNLVMLKDFTGQVPGTEVLRRFGYRSLETEPNMVLEINPQWRHYDDYLTALGARYRRSAKDQVKRLAAAGCREERLDHLEPHATQLHELYLAVHGRAPLRLVTLPESYLPALARAAGADFRCHVIRRNGAIVGFIVVLRDGDTAVAYTVGFDRAAAADGLPVYLRLLHRTIGDAIEWGCQRLSLGRTALEPKAGLGARPEPMTVWLRHRVPSVNWLLAGLLNAVPHAEAPERNPFKAAAIQENNLSAA